MLWTRTRWNVRSSAKRSAETSKIRLSHDCLSRRLIWRLKIWRVTDERFLQTLIYKDVTVCITVPSCCDIRYWLFLHVVWLWCFMSPSWSWADGTDDPVEAAKDSTFVKILLKLIQEGEKRSCNRHEDSSRWSISSTNVVRSISDSTVLYNYVHVFISSLQNRFIWNQEIR